MKHSKHNPSVILLAGIPATGKSTYGRWLERQKGFFHLDLENEAAEPKKSLAAGFFASANSISDYLAKLKNLRTTVILDWGFPPDNLWFVEKLKKEGVTLWWFDGDRDAARKAFIERNTVPLECLDIQMLNIESHWKKIEQVFHPNIIPVLSSDGTRLALEEISERMFA